MPRYVIERYLPDGRLVTEDFDGGSVYTGKGGSLTMANTTTGAFRIYARGAWATVRVVPVPVPGVVGSDD